MGRPASLGVSLNPGISCFTKSINASSVGSAVDGPPDLEEQAIAKPPSGTIIIAARRVILSVILYLPHTQFVASMR